MVAQRSLVLLAAIFAAARSQAPVARYLRGEGREDEEAPALHYFATDDPVFVNRELKVIERWSGTIEKLFEKFSNRCWWFYYTQQVVLEDAPEGSGAGESVAISDSGDVVAVGAPYFAEGGRVRMYVRSSTTLWPQLGNDILGEAGGRLGSRVALSGDGSTVAVDVRRLEGTKFVRVYRLSDERKAWGLIGTIYDSPAQAIALSRDGNIVAIGNGRSTVRVFEYAGGQWVQLGGYITGGNSFGSAVDLKATGQRSTRPPKITS